MRIGNKPLGGLQPLRLQSMTTTLTTDTEASVAQCIDIIKAGTDYIRLTTQGLREAENLKNIREALHRQGFDTPLVADVHFNPRVADAAAAIVEKVRINPGNYVDPARTFKELEYTDEEYAAELARLEERFVQFLDICRAHGTAVRIGVNMVACLTASCAVMATHRRALWRVAWSSCASVPRCILTTW